MLSKLIQAVTLLIFIWELRGSNLDQDTRFPACGCFFPPSESSMSFEFIALYRAII